MISGQSAVFEVSDSALAGRAAAGDGPAFQELYLRHKRRVYSLCLRMTGNTAESEDLTQEVFIKVLRYISGFRGESTFKTWLLRVTSNHVLMHFNKRRRNVEEPANDVEIALPAPGNSEHHKQAIRILNRIALERAIARLPAGYRMVFILYHVEGHEHREIALMLGHSVGTSKSQLFKARMMLRALLRQKAWAEVA